MTKLDVTFDSAGIEIAANLYLPDFPAGHLLPGIVVGHPGTGVKEQTAGSYAASLAERGFVTLAFDAAYQGASGGLPRGLEDPAQRVEDFKAAVSFLTTRPEVDANLIGVLGICASGGYSLPATAGDHRIKAVATVSAADVARQFRYGADGTQDPAVFQGMLDAAASARTAAAHGEDPGTLPLFPETIEQARALGGEHAAEGFEYYCTPRAEHERAAKSFHWTSVDKLATFDAFTHIPLIGQRPLLMVAGSRAVTAWMTIEAFQQATGPKDLFWVENASHVDLYDKQPYVAQTVDRLATFFDHNLSKSPPPA
ncbi:alpha/beta hydrolase [Kribbella sp. NPDC023855]|uniref:alpha/beta hydrolase n=1 Tax=Kribbella sp. NPDC023855 TaxID=3154698 RepID=UPI0033C585D3